MSYEIARKVTTYYTDETKTPAVRTFGSHHPESRIWDFKARTEIRPDVRVVTVKPITRVKP